MYSPGVTLSLLNEPCPRTTGVPCDQYCLTVWELSYYSQVAKLDGGSRLDRWYLHMKKMFFCIVFAVMFAKWKHCVGWWSWQSYTTAMCAGSLLLAPGSWLSHWQLASCCCPLANTTVGFDGFCQKPQTPPPCLPNLHKNTINHHSVFVSAMIVILDWFALFLQLSFVSMICGTTLMLKIECDVVYDVFWCGWWSVLVW